MAYLKKDYKAIYETLAEQLKKRLPGLTDYEQGSVIRSLLETVAFEQAIFYEQLDYVYNAAFVNTASGINLEKVVSILNVKRGEPDYALGQVTFFKTAGFEGEVHIPIGTLVATEDNPDENPSRKAYLTITPAVMGLGTDQVTAKVQADTRGKVMETEAESVTVIPQPIEGVAEVSNVEPIVFVGKQRETDEELRDRAKNTLLAAGQASQSSITQALLAMPNILDVKIEELEANPGVINVYVDGLTPDNSKALGQRLDDSRAAGIYARLRAADIAHFHGVMQITPHQDVIDAEIPLLERQVYEVVNQYLKNKKMGDPLSITQLTSTILGVKGVQDLAKYEVTLKEDNVLRDPPIINTPQDVGEAMVKKLVGIDENGHEVFEAPEDQKSISFSDFGRFNLAQLRIASGVKALPIQIQVKIQYPDAPTAATIAQKAKNALDKQDFSVEAIADDKLPVSQTVLNDFQQEVNAYFAQCKMQAIAAVAAVRIDPIGNHLPAFVTTAKKQSGLFEEDQPPKGVFAMDEQALKNSYYGLVQDNMAPLLQEGIKSAIKTVANQSAGEFPASEISKKMVTKVTLDLTAQLDRLRKNITALNQTLANDQILLVKETNEKEGETILDRIKSNQASLLTQQAAVDDLQSKTNHLTATLQEKLAQWSATVQAKLASILTAKALASLTDKSTNKSNLGFSLRLRSKTHEGDEYYDTPIPISFIETPVFDYLWIYAKDLRIAGKLVLSLPVTLQASDKAPIFAQTLEAMNEVLYNAKPETNIEIARLLAAAKKHEQVLDAHFEKGTLAIVAEQQIQLTPIPDRVNESIIKVLPSEKVLLSERFFEITG